jgi:DNA-binding transcriptional LysR family regulator
MLEHRKTTNSVQLRSLRLFCDVVDRKSFSAAAAEHGLTQGAASQAVQHLEDLVQVQLFDRTTRPYLLTAEGLKLYEGLSEMIRGFDTLVDEVRGKAGDVSGYISVASIYSIGFSYLPGIEEQFKQRFPNATIQTQLSHPDDVYRAVEQGKVDIGFVSYPESTRTIFAMPWREEQMILVASPRHRLSKQATVTPKDLTGVGLVAFAQELPIRHAVDKALRSLDISIRIVVELDNIDSVKHAAIVNSGVAVLPELTVKNELAAGSLKRLNCPEFALTRPIGYLQRRDKTLSRVARALVDLLAQTASVADSTSIAVESDSTASSSKKKRSRSSAALSSIEGISPKRSGRRDKDSAIEDATLDKSSVAIAK